MADLTTLTDVKLWLNITSDTSDAILTKLIAGASSFIEGWLSRPLASAAYTERYNGTGAYAMLLNNYPITAVSSLVIDGATVPAAASSTGNGYLFDTGGLYLVGPYCFTRGRQNITITYTAGYATIPANIQQACFELVSKKYKERDRIGQNSKTLAAEIVSFAPSDLSDEVKSILNNYRKVAPI